jgi:uncharacterized protein YbjT (DUF2867 family)
MPTIAVFGATGAQGGSVVRQLLKNPEWKVRGITRNVNSPGAKKLAEQVHFFLLFYFVLIHTTISPP